MSANILECDRSFTRSDALAKHMRTVHETEALRPSDPVPKNSQPTPANKVQRIKLKLNLGSKDDTEHSTNGDSASNVDGEEPELIPVPEFTPDLGFDRRELELPPSQLYRLLRRQIHWAQIESDKLKEQWQHTWRPKREHAWREKESVFENVIDTEGRLSEVLTNMQNDNGLANGRPENVVNEAVST